MGFWDWAIEAVDKVEKKTMDKLDKTDRKLDNFYDEVYRQKSKFYRMNEYQSLEDNLEILFESKEDVKRKQYMKRKVPKIGDIVGVYRYYNGIQYEHFGIYSSKGSVIQYTATDYEDKCVIRETSFEEFLGRSNSDRYFIFDCESIRLKQEKDDKVVYGVMSSISSSIRKPDMKFKKTEVLYSATETVGRARSRLGEAKYNVALNNCEHFAIWCKTGQHVSYQAELSKYGERYWLDYNKELMYK